MKSNKTRVPARDSYRVDHADMGEWFYAECWATREEAQAYIDGRGKALTYKDKLTIVKFHEPAHDQYHLGTMQL